MVGAGCVGAAGYIARLALKNPDCTCVSYSFCQCMGNCGTVPKGYGLGGGGRLFGCSLYYRLGFWSLLECVGQRVDCEGLVLGRGFTKWFKLKKKFKI